MGVEGQVVHQHRRTNKRWPLQKLFEIPASKMPVNLTCADHVHAVDNFRFFPG